MSTMHRKLSPAPIARSTEVRPLASATARRFALPAVATLLAAMAVTACSSASQDDDGIGADEHVHRIEKTKVDPDPTIDPTVATIATPVPTHVAPMTGGAITSVVPVPRGTMVVPGTVKPPSMPVGAAGGPRPITTAVTTPVPPVPTHPKLGGKVAAVHPTT